MLLHGLDADPKFRSGSLVRLAFGDQLGNLHLARGQMTCNFRSDSRRSQGCPSLAIAMSQGDRGVEEPIARVHGPYRLGEDQSRGLFDQVPGRAEPVTHDLVVIDQ